MDEIICPNCGSRNTYRSKKFNAWICEDCEQKFAEAILHKSWNDGLMQDKYWNNEFSDVAPYSLAISYQQLYDYIKEGNIGCTLFLIRDVYELMIKTPVVILLNGICTAVETVENPYEFLESCPKIKSLYMNSMQILTTGKWWECVRISAGLTNEINSALIFNTENSNVYRVTVEYLSKIYKMFWFQIPGNKKTNMVSWRNRAVGHSCLASNPEDSYNEISPILLMFKNVIEYSIPFYSRVMFADIDKNILRRNNEISSTSKKEVYIVYKEDNSTIYIKMHGFVERNIHNLAYYDGYEKGKAYMLNYGDGKRYIDSLLSNHIKNVFDAIKGSNDKVIGLSTTDVYDKNVETVDIELLENYTKTKYDIVNINYLYLWLMNQVNINKNGFLILQAEMGMGKTTFCNTINQLKASNEFLPYLDEVDGWSLFMESTLIRVWNFNAFYFGDKTIYIKGIQDALLTIDFAYEKQSNGYKANKLIGSLSTLWDNLLNCPEDLRSTYFAEALNATADELFSRTGKEKLILAFDGVDEIFDYETFLTYLPDMDKLAENVYILLVMRCSEELPHNLVNYIDNKNFTAKLCFYRNKIIEEYNGKRIESKGNDEYKKVLLKFVDEEVKALKLPIEDGEQIISTYNNRFSEVTAFLNLCRVNSRFHNVKEDIFSTFIEEIKNNSPTKYFTIIFNVLNTLAWGGDALTFKELSFLAGEEYVSYRFIGMLNDLSAFIDIIRTDRGSCIELSHKEWEEETKKIFPLGGIEFRMRCDMLLDRIEEIRIRNKTENIFLDSYSGERWLISHIFEIYIRDWTEIKNDWFENVRISIIEDFYIDLIERTIASERFSDLINTFDLKRIFDSYSVVINLYSDDVSGRRGSRNSGIFQTNRLMYTIASFFDKYIEKMDPTEDVYNKYLEITGDLWHSLSVSTPVNADAVSFKKKSIDRYDMIYSKYLKNDDIELSGVAMYKKGKVLQMEGMDYGALYQYEGFIKKIKSSYDSISLNLKDYLCRAYIRVAQILLNNNGGEIDINKVTNHLDSAMNIADDLINRVVSVDYISSLGYCEEVYAKFCKVLHNSHEEVKHLNNAVKLYDKMMRLNNNVSYLNSKKIFLNRIYEIYLTDHSFQDAKLVLNEIEKLDIIIFGHEDKNTLKKKMELLKEMGISYAEITDKLETLTRKENKQKLAYSQIYQLLLQSNSTDSVPESTISFLDENRDPTIKIVFDYNIPMSQQLTEEALSLLAVINTLFWRNQYPDSASKYEANQINYEESRWDEINNILSTITYSGDLSDFEGCEKNVCFNEAYKLMENLPVRIYSSIPLSIIVFVRDHQIPDYVCDLDEKPIQEMGMQTLKLLKIIFSASGVMNC